MGASITETSLANHSHNNDDCFSREDGNGNNYYLPGCTTPYLLIISELPVDWFLCAVYTWRQRGSRVHVRIHISAPLWTDARAGVTSLLVGWSPRSAGLERTYDPVTRLKLSMGPIRGPYSLYPRHVRASMLPKKRLSTHTMHFKWHHRNQSKMTMSHWKGNESWIIISCYSTLTAVVVR